MDIIEVAVRNARIDAQARAKKLQVKAPGKDKTRRQRAKDANVRDGLVRLDARRTAKRVHFGAYSPVAVQQPLRSILKPPKA